MTPFPDNIVAQGAQATKTTSDPNAKTQFDPATGDINAFDLARLPASAESLATKNQTFGQKARSVDEIVAVWFKAVREDFPADLSVQHPLDYVQGRLPALVGALTRL